MTFKVGDLARIVQKDEATIRAAYLTQYIGQIVEIIGLDTRSSKRRGSYHRVKAMDGHTFHTAVYWLEKIDPPREDLKIVDWETVPWRPTITV